MTDAPPVPLSDDITRALMQPIMELTRQGMELLNTTSGKVPTRVTFGRAVLVATYRLASKLEDLVHSGVINTPEDVSKHFTPQEVCIFRPGVTSNKAALKDFEADEWAAAHYEPAKEYGRVLMQRARAATPK